MQTVESYLAEILSLGSATPVATRSLNDSIGLTLAEDVTARFPVPAFVNSAMDGFALRAADVAAATPAAPVTLRVVGDVPAGGYTDDQVVPGAAIRIMTGAPLPGGADAIVPVEDTDQPAGPAEVPASVRVRAAVPPGRHVREAGEDVAIGEVVLRAGTVVNPAAIAAAAAIGYGSLAVHRRPRVAILATGSELVPPGHDLDRGKIPDSNSFMLAGLVAEAGGEVWAQRSVSDDVTQFTLAVKEALGADLIITSGGVSAGAFDVVKQFGGGLQFTKVAMQPGKPQGYGKLATTDGRQVPVLALPGNPVSVFVSFHLFVKPLLAVLGGTTASTAGQRVFAAAAWKSPAGRRQFVPVALTAAADGGLACTPVHRLGSGSHLIASLHKADGLAVVPEQVTDVTIGDEVTVIEV